MAQFPIQRTGRTPSYGGSGVMIPMEYATMTARTGEVIGAALINLGSAGIEEAQKWNELDARRELSEQTRAAGMRLNQLADEYRDEDDEKVYKEKFETAFDEIKSLRPQNKLAGRAYDAWLAREEPAWRQSVGQSIKTRAALKAKEDLALRKETRLGKETMFLTNVELNDGHTMVWKLIHDPAYLADSGLTAEEAVQIASRTPMLAGQIKADEEARVTLAKATETGRQEQAKRTINSLLMNIGNPMRPQPTLEAIHAAGLDAADELRYIQLVKNYSQEGFTDQGDVLAVVLQKQRDGKLTSDEVWSAVGHGLSPQTAAQLTNPDSFYQDWGFRQAEQFLKGSLSYNELSGWENPQGQLAYQRAMKELTDAIGKSDPPVRGKGIQELAYRIATPHLIDYWRNVTSKGIDAQSREALARQLQALGGNAPAPGATVAPAPAPTEQDKAKEIFGIK